MECFDFGCDISTSEIEPWPVLGDRHAIQLLINHEINVNEWLPSKWIPSQPRKFVQFPAVRLEHGLSLTFSFQYPVIWTIRMLMSTMRSLNGSSSRWKSDESIIWLPTLPFKVSQSHWTYTLILYVQLWWIITVWTRYGVAVQWYTRIHWPFHRLWTRMRTVHL